VLKERVCWSFGEVYFDFFFFFFFMGVGCCALVGELC
jgi:hypothetical protein